jgi:hypothetical protein
MLQRKKIMMKPLTRTFVLFWASMVLAAPSESTEAQHVLSVANPFRCDLPPAIEPLDGLPSSRVYFRSHAALVKQARRLAAVVKVPTISYDDGGSPGEDPRWEIFKDLHRVLRSLFPHV